MDSVKLMVDLHLANAKTIFDVAKLVQMPSETLRKKFLREEGIHLNDYIHHRKVQAMKELLLISDHPCFAVCYTVGFREDTGAKIFKKIAGMTMQQFRDKYKQEYERLHNDPLQKKQLRLILSEAFCIDPNSEEIEEEEFKEDNKVPHPANSAKKPKQALRSSRL